MAQVRLLFLLPVLKAYSDTFQNVREAPWLTCSTLFKSRSTHRSILWLLREGIASKYRNSNYLCNTTCIRLCLIPTPLCPVCTWKVSWGKGINHPVSMQSQQWLQHGASVTTKGDGISLPTWAHFWVQSVHLNSSSKMRATPVKIPNIKQPERKYCTFCLSWAYTLAADMWQRWELSAEASLARMMGGSLMGKRTVSADGQQHFRLSVTVTCNMRKFSRAVPLCEWSLRDDFVLQLTTDIKIHYCSVIKMEKHGKWRPEQVF